MTPQSLLLCVSALLALFSSTWCSPLCNNQCCHFVEGFPARLRKLREDYSHIRDFYVSKTLFCVYIPVECSITWTSRRPCGSLQVMLHFLTSFCTHLELLALSQRIEHDLFLLAGSIQRLGHNPARPERRRLLQSKFLYQPARRRLRSVCRVLTDDNTDTAFTGLVFSSPWQSPFACHTMNSVLDFYLSTVLPTAMASVTEDNKDLKPHVESIQQIFDHLKRDVIKCVSSGHVFLLRGNKNVNTARALRCAGSAHRAGLCVSPTRTERSHLEKRTVNSCRG